MSNWWWDAQDPLSARATIVPVICASHKTRMTNFSGDQHAWRLNLTIGNNRKHIHQTPKPRGTILLGLIPCPPEGAKNIVEAWQNTVGPGLSQLRHFDITGPSLKRDCADGFQRQCHPHFAAWVSDHPNQGMAAQVAYGSCPSCDIPKGAPKGHSIFQTLDNSRDQHIYSELLEDNIIDALHTLGVGPIRNQFWKIPLCNVDQL